MDYTGMIGDGTRRDALNTFEEHVVDEAVQNYIEEYAPRENVVCIPGEKKTGPGLAVDGYDSAAYSLEGEDWEVEFEATIIDSSFPVDELVDEEDRMDPENYFLSLKSESESEDNPDRSRFISLSPSLGSDDMYRDEWFRFARSMQDTLEPEKTATLNGVDFNYFFSLEEEEELTSYLEESETY